MSSKAKIKGTRVENEIVKLYKKEGYKARRQPMSGAISAFPHDVFIDDLHEGTNAEVKARKNGEGFKQLEDWKGKADLLILKRNNKSPMVVMDWELYRIYLNDIKRPTTVEAREEKTIQPDTRTREAPKRKIRNGGWRTGHKKAQFPKRPFRHHFSRQTKTS